MTIPASLTGEPDVPLPNSIKESATTVLAVLTVVVEPLTVRLPVTVKLPPTSTLLVVLMLCIYALDQ